MISSIVYTGKEIKVKVNTKRKYMNSWAPRNTLSNDEWVTKEIWKEIIKFLELNENGNKT